jgi:two-component system sensor histidine kinase RstB
MHSVFLRIYSGMIVAMLMALFIAAVATYYTNEHRITSHIGQYYGGTFRLIGEGVSRHEDLKREQWLKAVEQISGLYFEQKTATSSGLSASDQDALKQQGFLLQMNASLNKGVVFIQLPERDEILSMALDDFGTSLVRASAFLMLNELGRHKSSERIHALGDIRALFQYPIKLRSQDQLILSAASLRQIKRGRIAVVLKNSTASTPSLSAYAPLGNSPYVLELGAIPLFDWFPLGLIGAVISLALIFMATATYLFVHPIEKRLNAIDLQIEQIGADQEMSITPSYNKDAISRLGGTVSDMASRIHRLIDAQGDMVRAISHELRTPITRIRFRMSSIEDAEVADLVEDTDGVERDLVELEKLIDEVLTFSKLKREKPMIAIEAIGLDTFFSDIEHAISPLAEQIEVNFDCGDSVNFNADRRFLHRAIENLVLNALRYAKSKVEVRYVTSDKYQHIFVSDDGPGVPEADRQYIFEPFGRLDASRCRQSGGYGLGLAIVRQIALWHQGSAQVKISDMGGADMVFSWPLSLVQPEPSKP